MPRRRINRLNPEKGESPFLRFYKAAQINYTLNRLLLFIGLLFLQPLQAQLVDAIYPIDYIQVSQGLPDRTVTSIVQDHYGFMWFGTNNGLCRYDGYRLVTYQHRPDDSASISNNYIRCLYVDRKGRIWVGTRGGLNCYDHISDNFRRYNRSSQLDGDTVHTLIEDPHGRIWVATNVGGLQYLDPKGKFFRPYLHPFLRPKERTDGEDYCIVNQLMLDSQGNLWAASLGAGLVKINTSTLKYKNYIQYRLPATPYAKTTIVSYRAMLMKDNKILLGNNYGITEFDPQYGTFTNLLVPPPPILSNQQYGLNVENFWCDEYGNVWFTVHPYRIPFNLCKIDLNNYRTTYYSTDPMRVSNIEIQHIRAIYEDNTGIFWLGTDGDGIIKFQQPSNFKSLYINISDTTSEVSGTVTALCEDSRGQLWIGTPKGLYRYSPNENILYKYKPDSSRENRISSEFITTIFEDRHKRLWIGTHRWFYRYNRQSDDFTLFTFPVDPKQVKKISYVRSISQGQGENLWIGTAAGLYSFSPKYNTFTHQPTPLTNVQASYYDRLISEVYTDRQGDVWIGSWSYGLLRWIPARNQWQFFSTESFSYNITNNKITDILEDSQGRIWIATDGGGLNIFDCSSQRMQPFEHNYMICSPRIIGLHEDASGSFWILSDAGISRYTPRLGTLQNFSKAEGLTYFQGKYEYQSILSPQPLSTEKIFIRRQLTIYNNHYMNRKGWIYVGGSNGINYFHPDSLLKKTPKTKLVITNATIPQHRSLTFSDLIRNNHLVLNHYQNNIIIDYALLNFGQRDKISYAHILEGYDRDWSPRHTSNTTIYSSLPPGKYTFRVNGVSTGVGSVFSEAVLYITIKPPFWATTWFKFALIFSAGLLISGIFIVRTNVIRRQKQALEVEVAIRTLELEEKTKALEAAHANLERKVAERTAELVETNVALEREIQVRKETENALRASEATARVLLNAPSDLAFLLAPDGTILALNRALAVRFGLPEEEIVGKKFDLFVAPDVAKIRHAKLRECIEKKQLIRWEDISRDTIYDNSFYPIMNSAGEVTTIAAYAKDITDQKMIEKFLRDARATLEEEVQKRTQELKQANEQLRKEIHFRQITEARLRASEQRFRDLFQNSIDPIWTTDNAGTFLSVNKSTIDISGFTKKELLNKNPLDLVPPAHRFRVLLNFHRVLRGESVNFECDLVTKSGEVRNMWLKMRPLTEDGQILGMHGIGRDITQLKAAARDLQASEAAKRQSLRQFTLQLAHEIKNPLSTIKSSAQLVANSQSAQKDPHIQRHMETINRNVELCNQVIQELYAYTHPHGYQYQLLPADQLMQKLRERVASRSETFPQIKTNWSLPEKLPLISVDEERLLNALQNIYFNALESISNKGRISCTAQAINKNTQVRITIKDTGAGIAAEDLDKIFQPFYSRKAKGFGIGLTVAKETIEACGGSITVTSQIGKGTTFTIILPTINDAQKIHAT